MAIRHKLVWTRYKDFKGKFVIDETDASSNPYYFFYLKIKVLPNDKSLRFLGKNPATKEEAQGAGVCLKLIAQ